MITQRVLDLLDRYMEGLDDDQVGTDARTEIKAFSEYAFDMFQAYTALILTLASGVVQVLSTDGTGLLGIILIIGVFVVATVLLYNKDYVGDPMMYQSFTKKWILSPVSWTIIGLNVIIILVILG